MHLELSLEEIEGCMSGEVEEKFRVCDWRVVKVS